MAIPAFHFSGVYKDLILKREKNASVLVGEYSYPLGSSVLIYVSETKNMFDENPQEKRYGNAKIEKNCMIRMSELRDEQAKKCGYEDSAKLIHAMKEWFPGLKDDTPLTYVEFKLNEER